jgi:hypothetical protein
MKLGHLHRVCLDDWAAKEVLGNLYYLLPSLSYVLAGIETPDAYLAIRYQRV